MNMEKIYTTKNYQSSFKILQPKSDLFLCEKQASAAV